MTSIATPADLVGRTVHLLRGTKYAGEWTVTEVGPVDENGWFLIVGGGRWYTRMEDVFDSEEQARAEARNRRAPRRPRTPTPLYGDFAQLAALNGITTDGTGRVNR